ncbi:MAG: GTP cyclohydrolase II [bacterium]
MSITNRTKLVTEFGEMDVSYHESDNGFCVSLSKGGLKNGPVVRIHSSCLFSEALHSIDCDCNLQLASAIKYISEEGNGAIIYLYQEGRGHGLDKKIKAMGVMRDMKCDTAEAFHHLNYELDPRDYKIAVDALKDLNICREIRLISNNPRKIIALERSGFKVKRLTLTYPLNEATKKYLQSKKDKLGHVIDWIGK